LAFGGIPDDGGGTVNILAALLALTTASLPLHDHLQNSDQEQQRAHPEARIVPFGKWPCPDDPIAADGSVRAPRLLKRLELDLVFHPEDVVRRERLAAELTRWADKINTSTCAPPDIRLPLLYRLYRQVSDLEPSCEDAKERVKAISRQMRIYKIDIPSQP